MGRNLYNLVKETPSHLLTPGTEWIYHINRPIIRLRQVNKSIKLLQGRGLAIDIPSNDFANRTV